MSKDKRNWEKEYKKCISSPYYFYINFVGIKEADGTIRKATTAMTEEEFNKAYEDMYQKELITKKEK